MRNKTDEFSFILKPSNISGVGVFATHDIAKGAKLSVIPEPRRERILNTDAVPEEFKQYCIHRENNKLWCPDAFNIMKIGWYINHSSSPNAAHKGGDYVYYATKDIVAGEEVLIDYNTLEEPENARDDFYKE